MMQEHTVPAASKGSARRHRVEGGRQHQVKIRFTDAEYEAVAARAADARVSVQRFLVDSALTRRRPPPSAPSALAAELAGLRRLTANLANNVNQIARRLNVGADPDLGITAAADSVRRTMNRLDSVLAWLGAPHAGKTAPPVGKSVPDQRNAHPSARTAPSASRNARPHPGAVRSP